MIPRQQIEVVLFKRDLRIHDHAPLFRAAKAGAVLPLYVVEPSQIHAPDFDSSHWTFTRESLIELREALAMRGQSLIVRVGETVDVLESLRERFTISGLWAHEETTNSIAYARDRALRLWAKQNRVPFTEIPPAGVVRRLKSRDDFAGLWEERMSLPITPTPHRLTLVCGIVPGDIPDHAALNLPPDPRAAALQTGGETAARATFDSFLGGRVTQYQHGMSSPNSAAEHCSRLSSYLAYGNLSLRQVVQRSRETLTEMGLFEPPRSGTPEAMWYRAIRSFEARLHWRDHFIQKIESEPRFEFENQIAAFDGMRENEFSEARFEAWKAGMTGYPMVDACMRSLHATGWINFRMRAMLCSFASYHLWLHWQKPGVYLAKQFVDYEAGIHYCQMQMQSGLTGTGTLRIYNPTKQAQDQDRDGTFIRRWLPELSRVPKEFLFTPWTMPYAVQEGAGCRLGKQYPLPIVDDLTSVRFARLKIAEVRHRAETTEQANALYQKHANRKSFLRPNRTCVPSAPRKEKPADTQLTLDW